MALTSEQLSTLFTLNPGDMTSGPTPSGKSYVIAALEEIKEANPASDPEGVSKMRITIADEMPGDLLAQYQAGLEGDAGVVIYPGALDAVFGDGS
jgi:parvulin-like peptidyl-prolyl isomerase